jgi:hypothetical protein
MNQNLRYTFVAHAVVCVVFGLCFLLLPATVAGMYGMKGFDPFTARVLGAALLALALSSWLSYRAAGWGEVRIVVQMEILFTVVGAVATLYSLLFDAAPALAWGNFLIFVVFGALWIYFYTRAPARAAAPRLA